MSIEDKLNRVSQLLEKLLLQSENKKQKYNEYIDHPTQKLMDQFIEGIKTLDHINKQINKNGKPHFISLKEVRFKTGLSSSTIDRMQKNMTFPSKRNVGDNSKKWLSTEIDEWINSREKVF